MGRGCVNLGGEVIDHAAELRPPSEVAVKVHESQNNPGAIWLAVRRKWSKVPLHRARHTRE